MHYPCPFPLHREIHQSCPARARRGAGGRCRFHLLPRDDPGESRGRRGLLPDRRPQPGHRRTRRDLPLLTPCNGCYSTFKSVLSDLKVDWRMRERINKRLAGVGLELRGDVDVWHLVEWLSEDLGPAALSNRVAKPLWGMKLAVHYGCHLLRPSPAVRWDSPTAPTKFEQVVRALGATVIDYQTKMDCCGNALDRVGERRSSLEMLTRKLADVAQQGVDALVVACPSCFLQFDLNQATLLRESAAAGVPVFYITELIALALGMDAAELGLDMHRVGVGPFLERWAVKLQQRAALMRSFDLRGLETCASCGACDQDCPVAQTNPDFVPSQIIARLVAGELEAVLESPDPWRCVDCMTCFERCHSRMGMAEVFENLKRLARERGAVPAAVRSSFDMFMTTGALGSGRPATREKLGLPEMQANGLDDLKRILGLARADEAGESATVPAHESATVRRATAAVPWRAAAWRAAANPAALLPPAVETGDDGPRARIRGTQGIQRRSRATDPRGLRPHGRVRSVGDAHERRAGPAQHGFHARPGQRPWRRLRRLRHLPGTAAPLLLPPALQRRRGQGRHRVLPQQALPGGHGRAHPDQAHPRDRERAHAVALLPRYRRGTAPRDPVERRGLRRPRGDGHQHLHRRRLRRLVGQEHGRLQRRRLPRGNRRVLPHR